MRWLLFFLSSTDNTVLYRGVTSKFKPRGAGEGIVKFVKFDPAELWWE